MSWIAGLLFAAAAPAPAVQMVSDNPEIIALRDADQAPRSGKIADPLALFKADAARRARARQLLDAGMLRTGNDFHAAALIFQHGSKLEDHLIAHVLAVRALALGVKKAEWLAAASLDRYLQGLERDQIYGTQYEIDPVTGKAHQGRYDKALLPDQIRIGAGVEPLAGQEARRAQIEKRYSEK